MRLTVPALGFSLLAATAAHATDQQPQSAAVRSQNATKMNEALNAMRSKNVPHLEGVLKERKLPRSVQTAPSRFLDRGVSKVLKPRLELGLTNDATIRTEERGQLNVNGNRGNHIETTVNITAYAGSENQKLESQHMQVTSQTTSNPRDPRFGIEATQSDVKMWKTAGTPNGNYVTGPGKLRTIKPLSEGVQFRGQSLPAGSHLVTVESGPQAQMNFNANGYNTPSSIQNVGRTQHYVLIPGKDGNQRRVKLNAKTDQEVIDHLNANTSMKSFTIKNGQVEDNYAPGHDPESLKRGNFQQ